MASGKYCIELKYATGIKYFHFESEKEYTNALNRLDDILKVQEV